MSPAKRLLKDRKGAVALIMAAATPIIVGGLGLSIDTIQWTLTKRQMQRQADSGAIAGAYGLAQGRNVAAVVADDLARNAYVDMTNDPVVENAPTAGPQAGNTRAVRVALSTNVNLPFTGFFLNGPLTIPAEATASLVANGEFCALSLETANATGITLWGSSTVDLGCGMATNSVSANAVAAGGSSTVSATPIAAVGGVPQSNNYAPGTVLIPYAVPQPDPFQALPDPVVSGAAQNGNVNSNQTRTLSPGTYNGMDLKGTVTLNPGTYVIDGGDFSVGAQAKVTGNGVTIILTSKTAANNPNSIGQIKMNGGATVNLTAPSTGTYQGVLIYQDRRATLSNQSNKVNGNSASKLQGAIYVASQEVEFTGTTGLNTNCFQLVARRITWSGNSAITNVCPAGSGAQSFTGTAVRLVG
jgi:Flp pilus assembly protein TadG